MTIYEKAEFLKTKGYEIGVAEGTEDYPAHVTKKGTQLNCSVNYAYNIEIINLRENLIDYEIKTSSCTDMQAEKKVDSYLSTIKNKNA